MAVTGNGELGFDSERGDPEKRLPHLRMEDGGKTTVRIEEK